MSFEDIKFSDEIKKSIKRMNYEKATEVQLDTIPLILDGHNVIVKSHTGSGKTAAFGIPISEQIFKSKGGRAALVLCPTRELAVQVKNELKKINSDTRLNVTAFYGGHGMMSERKAISMGIDILVATPGRLLDHFKQGQLKARMFKVVVLDEADRMLDMGFIHDLKDILHQVKPGNIHLFSATLDGSVAKLIQEYIPTYEEVILPDEIVGKNIFERHIKVPFEEKLEALQEIIEEAKDGRVLVFVGTKRNADFLSRKLSRMDYKVECIHGGKTQRSREYALENFKSGKKRILIGTDVAARGLQIDNVEYVVNYDLAQDADTHKHRIGRTGRMGDTGHAITFVGADGNIIAPAKSYGKGKGNNRSRGGFRNNQRSYKGGSNFGGRSGGRSGWRSGGRSSQRSSEGSGGRSGYNSRPGKKRYNKPRSNRN